MITVLTADELDDLAAHADIEFRNYSGRGMYGARCLAIEGGMVDYGRLLIAATDLLGVDRAGMFTAVSTDAMGRGTVFYWRHIEPPHEAYPDHVNDLGDWCPWSGKPVADAADPRCPAGCRESDTDEDDE